MTNTDHTTNDPYGHVKRRPALGARVQPWDQVGPFEPIGTVVRRPPGVTYVIVKWDGSARYGVASKGRRSAEQCVHFAERNLVLVRPAK